MFRSCFNHSEYNRDLSVTPGEAACAVPQLPRVLPAVPGHLAAEEQAVPGLQGGHHPGQPHQAHHWRSTCRGVPEVHEHPRHAEGQDGSALHRV